MSESLRSPILPLGLTLGLCTGQVLYWSLPNSAEGYTELKPILKML